MSKTFKTTRTTMGFQPTSRVRRKVLWAAKCHAEKTGAERGSLTAVINGKLDELPEPEPTKTKNTV